MARVARLLRTEEQTVYHVMSRTALDGFPLGKVEKDYLVNIIKQLSRLYFTEIIGHCIMGSHFHLLVKMLPETDFSDDDIKQRFGTYFGEKRCLSDGQIPFFREKYSSLSEFVKEIKVSFSRFYNRRHNRRGYFWGGRFKSVIVEKGETLINCLAYIDLNPVRAGIVERPEYYRWNSIGYHVQTNNKDNFLSLDFGLKSSENSMQLSVSEDIAVLSTRPARSARADRSPPKWWQKSAIAISSFADQTGSNSGRATLPTLPSLVPGNLCGRIFCALSICSKPK
jgi:hypothetical protein